MFSLVSALLSQINHYVVSFLRRVAALPNDFAGVNPKTGAWI